MSHLDLDDPRRHVRVHEERIGQVANQDFPGHYPGEDHAWDLDTFKQNMHVQVNRLTESTVEFDLIGVDSSIANAIRRIAIAEVPTVAVENVYVYNNTSIMQDEVLAHRLGLVPIKVDPRKLKWKPPVGEDGVDHSNDENTLVFEFFVECERRRDARRDETDPEKLYINSSVYSGLIKWSPKGRQHELLNLPESQSEIEERAADPRIEPRQPIGGEWDEEPRVMYDDILLVKLRPGQQINMLLYAVKGIGKDHAKFSPVATASYRLLPYIKLLGEIPPHLAEKFRDCFPPGVIKLEYDERTKKNTKVVVANPRLDTVSREVLRHEEFKDLVQLNRIRDHFIYSVESTGAYPPQEIVPEAIRVMQDKITDVEACLRALYPSHEPGYQRAE